ncbi:MAG: histidinol dehydrogenase [candidate division WOR-3 bacterium]
MQILRSEELPEDFFRPQMEGNISLVRSIVNEVKNFGDRALNKYTKKFDKVSVSNFRVTPAELRKAAHSIDKHLLQALTRAKENIEKFSRAQLCQLKNFKINITNGVIAEQVIIPLERIGIYIPGGRFPLISTVLMCGVPAMVAGVKEIAICSPPTYQNSVHPLILATAQFLGIREVYKVGGIQAIAAMAYGTKTVKPVAKIFGPGNIFVASAKKYVFGDVGIDFIAGPTEILIIADESAVPEIVAADLLAQAEHDPNALPILVTNAPSFAGKVIKILNRQVKILKTGRIAKRALNNNGLIIIAQDIEEAIEIANKKAPEHLELQIKNPERYISRLKNYGTLFVGKYAAEVLGDYSSGLNHTLPTAGAARYTGGLHIKDFLKIQTVLRVNKIGLKRIGPIAQILAQTEGLFAHARSIEVRMR